LLTLADVASTLVRVALVTVALFAGAWLVLGIRAQDLESEARSPSSNVERSLSSLRRARLLSVDKEPLLNEGLVRFASGQHGEGIAIAKRVVAEEPDNFEAWLGLYYMYSTSRDSKRAAQAARRVRALNPFAGDLLKNARP
jgi:Flp pilus assembly protein TadD